MRSFTAAISPCPNDTFSFFFLIHDKPKDIEFNFSYHDIQELNKGAALNKWDIVKASFLTGYRIRDNYDLMPSGSAIGFGAGPVLLSLSKDALNKETIRVGIPGEDTTAHFLFDYYQKRKLQGKKIEKKHMLFSDIMRNLENKTIDIGVLIHEGRFVYEERNFFLVEDLGAFWEVEKKLPIPLGGIFIRKDIEEKFRHRVEGALKKSITEALKEKKENTELYKKKIFAFMRKHAQELDRDTIEKHIETYVNDDTIELSEKALGAIKEFYREIETT